VAVDSDEEVEAVRIREDSPQHSRPPKLRQSEDEDDFDIDVEDESSKFTTSPSDVEMAQESDSRNPRPPSNRPQPRQKPPFTKASKGKTNKKARRTVISDDDDDDDSMPWRSDLSADEDPPPSPPQTRTIASSSARTRKGKSRADFEDPDSLREDRPVPIGSKRPRPLDSEPAIDSNPPSPLAGVTVPIENREPVLKKKLPPIKKIKLSDSTASSPISTSKTTTTLARTEKPRFTVEGAGLPPPPSSLPRKPAATAGNADLDLSNVDVYKQLFSVSSLIVVFVHCG